MINRRDTRLEDNHYPAVKIYNLAGLLPDVTTDYARPLLLSVGMTPRQIEIVNAEVRPTIETYENEFYGILASDLRRLQRNIKDRLDLANEDASAVFQCLQRLSEGRSRFLWVPSLAQIDIETYIQSGKRNLSYVTPDTFDAFLKLYSEIILSPEMRLRRKYTQSGLSWMPERLSAWDRVVNSLIFADLGVPPGIHGAFGNYSMRRLAEAVLARFDAATRDLLHQELLSILSQPPSERIGYSDFCAVLSFDEIASRSRNDWDELRADLESGFAE